MGSFGVSFRIRGSLRSPGGFTESSRFVETAALKLLEKIPPHFLKRLATGSITGMARSAPLSIARCTMSFLLLADVVPPVWWRAASGL